MNKYISRIVEKELIKSVKRSPIIAVTGPRQTGKSTMLKHLFPKYNYISFDSTDMRTSAKNDPEMFIETTQKPIIIDEIQYAPEILPYMKIYVDKYRNSLKNKEVMGKFILTGSQVFTLMAGLTESLAGRISLFELFPFSFEELGKKPSTPMACYKQILKGFYPVPNTSSQEPNDYYGSYLSTYVERDVRQIVSVKDLSQFQKFVQLLAGRAGNMLNVANIAKDCGISHITAKNWISVLEASGIIYLLKPYYENTAKRLVKTPKIYFTDTGLLAYLLKYQDAQTLFAGAMQGAVFENMIVIEALKFIKNNKLNYDLCFYRDNNGVEIDLIIDKGESLSLCEIKSSKTLNSQMIKNLSLVNIPKSKKFVLSFNENKMPMGKEVMAISWKDFETII
jgi:predicted AAA+ superfamily ATPase